MGNLEKIPEQGKWEKEGLNSAEKEIAKVLMGSGIYDTLSREEKLNLIKFLEDRYPELAKHLNTEHIDA